MIFKRIVFLLPFLIFCLDSHASSGFRQVTVATPITAPLNVAVWYPSSSTGTTEKVGDNAAFDGVSVIQDGYPMAGKHPLLVISHGYNGNWRNLSWIAEAMAMQGYIVAAPDHPGTTTFNQNPDDAKKLWNRPIELSYVIDLVLRSPNLFGDTDATKIAALGHSLGGWTVISLAGAKFDSERFINNCEGNASRGDCKLIDRFGINNNNIRPLLSASYRDNRIRSVVSLDPGLAPGFTPKSLQNITIPVLLLAAQNDQLAQLPSKQESSYLATYIPSKLIQFKIIEGATHFSFMQLCKPNAESLINQESPGDGIVCHDGPNTTRENIHKRLLQEISSFLNTTLHYHPTPSE